MKQSLFIIFLTALITINMSLANAEIIRAKVSVVGMACPFCAYGVEKKLKKVEGVGSIIINMQEGTATMSAKNAESINVSRVPEAIKESGFSSGKIVITATGKIRTDNQEGLLLQVAGSKEEFIIKKFGKGIKKQALKYAEIGSLIEAAGEIDRKSDRTWTISVDIIKEPVQ